jgi:putative hydrolase of HD superfamily
MLTKGFVDRLFATSTIQRWTDHIRPMDLTALGKHAHMLVIAWVIGKRAERTEGWDVDWDYLIKGSLFELLRFSVLTDIKSQVLKEIRSNEDDKKKLDEYIVGELQKSLSGMPIELIDGMPDYYADIHGEASRWNAYKILRASSSLATMWEFILIEKSNPFLHDIKDTRQNIEAGVRQYQYIPAVLDLYERRNDLSRFTDLCGRLRFQLRWSQTPILPPRPVLDHELIVAYLSYACVVDTAKRNKTNEKWRRYSAFFGALFHDLPEVLTRDIVSPVKHGANIDGIIARIENNWFEKTISPMLPERLYREVKYFSIEEFENKEWPPEDWPDYLDLPKDGRTKTMHPGDIIKSCDKFAGFMEAYYSLTYGIKSDNLINAIYPNAKGETERRLLNKHGYDFGKLYTEYSDELRDKHKIHKAR